MSATPPDIYEEDELLAKAARMREGLAGQARTARSAGLPLARKPG